MTCPNLSGLKFRREMAAKRASIHSLSELLKQNLHLPQLVCQKACSQLTLWSASSWGVEAPGPTIDW